METKFKPLNEDLTFEKLSFVDQTFKSLIFDNCEFEEVDFSSTALISCKFTNCRFIRCNFSSTNINASQLYDIVFEECKILGVHFHACSDFLFSASFKNCTLDFSSFYQKKMQKTAFTDCSLKEVDFSESDLSQSVFDNCSLLDSVFYRTILKEVDFRTAKHFSINPEVNELKKARFTRDGLEGLLNKYNIIIE